MLHFFKKCYIFQDIGSTVGSDTLGAKHEVHFSVMEGGLSSPAAQAPRTPILQHRPAPLGPAYPPARRSLRGRAAAMKFAPGAKKCYSRPYRMARTWLVSTGLWDRARRAGPPN